MSYLDLEKYDRFAEPDPLGSTWIIRNLNFQHGPVVAEDGNQRWYTAARINLPFTRKPGLNNSVDVSFDLEYIETDSGGAPIGYEENLYLVAAEKGPAWNMQGTNPSINVLSYHLVDLTNIAAHAQPNTQQGRESLVTTLQNRYDSGTTNSFSFTNIPIPENKEVIFYLISERTLSFPHYIFVINKFAVHHSGESMMANYTIKDLADYAGMILKRPLEKEIVDRGPSGDHIIVERFSSPGDIYTMGEGSLDRLSGQYSPYNALSFRNRRLSNILNIESSKVYNGPYDSTIAPTQQIHDARADSKVPVHKTHRNTEHAVVSGPQNPLDFSGWTLIAGVDIIEV